MDQEKYDAKLTQKLEELMIKEIKQFDDWTKDIISIFCVHCKSKGKNDVKTTKLMFAMSLPNSTRITKRRYFCNECSHDSEIKQEFTEIYFNKDNQSK